MIADKCKLETLVLDADALVVYLSHLSNARLRITQKILAEEILPQLQDSQQFWRVFLTLYKKDSKQWLGTLLKALALRVQKIQEVQEVQKVQKVQKVQTVQEVQGGRYSEAVEAIGGISGEFTDIDTQKTISALLPLAKVPDQVRALFRACRLTESKDWIGYLLPVKTQVAGFVLLGALRYVENDKPLLVRVCRFLMKRGDAMAFSLASIICLSYDIQEVRGTFSLQLAPYELSRIETNFAAFCQAVKM